MSTSAHSRLATRRNIMMNALKYVQRLINYNNVSQGMTKMDNKLLVIRLKSKPGSEFNLNMFPFVRL
jgi:hypothetical protein